jgi:cytochrome c-type biogenesis protein CcmE
MKGKTRLVVGLAAIAVFATLGLLNFKQSMTPYVTFAEAKEAGRTVQVAGFPDHRGAGLDAEAGLFTFTMKDEAGDQLRVVYPGGKPGNFDQAQSVVVVGTCDGDVMEAKQILVKCPSKYETEGESHPGMETPEATPAAGTE